MESACGTPRKGCTFQIFKLLDADSYPDEKVFISSRATGNLKSIYSDVFAVSFYFFSRKPCVVANNIGWCQHDFQYIELGMYESYFVKKPDNILL